MRRAAELSTPVVEVAVREDGSSWEFDTRDHTYRDVPLAAQGRHQRTNFATAVNLLAEAGVALDGDLVARAAAGTVLPGRLHAISEKVFADVAHTLESAEILAAALRERFAGREVTLVFACALDKNAAGLAGILGPAASHVVLPRMPGPRSMPADDMLDAWRGVCRDVSIADSPREALDEALAKAGDSGVVCVCGSFVIVGAVMEMLGFQP